MKRYARFTSDSVCLYMLLKQMEKNTYSIRSTPLQVMPYFILLMQDCKTPYGYGSFLICRHCMRGSLFPRVLVLRPCSDFLHVCFLYRRYKGREGDFLSLKSKFDYIFVKTSEELKEKKAEIDFCFMVDAQSLLQFLYWWESKEESVWIGEDHKWHRSS